MLDSNQQNVKRALTGMGYRPMPGTQAIWAKPTGFAVLIFDFKHLDVSFDSVGRQGQSITYGRQGVSAEGSVASIIDSIAQAEHAIAETRSSGEVRKSFAFLTVQQMAEAAL